MFYQANMDKIIQCQAIMRGALAKNYYRKILEERRLMLEKERLNRLALLKSHESLWTKVNSRDKNSSFEIASSYASRKKNTSRLFRP